MGSIPGGSISRSLHADHVLDLGELDFLDAFDLHDVFDRLERPGVDDRLRSDGTDPGKHVELFLRGGVEVDLLARLELGHVLGRYFGGLAGGLGGRLGLGGGRGGDRDQVFERIDSRLAEALDTIEVVDRLERAGFDDGLGMSRTDARQFFERRRVGRIEIDLLGLGLRLGGTRCLGLRLGRQSLQPRAPWSEST